jgi:hypothetical protein
MLAHRRGHDVSVSRFAQTPAPRHPRVAERDDGEAIAGGASVKRLHRDGAVGLASRAATLTLPPRGGKKKRHRLRRADAALSRNTKGPAKSDGVSDGGVRVQRSKRSPPPGAPRMS